MISTAPAVIKALAAALRARPGLAGYHVYTAPSGDVIPNSLQFFGTGQKGSFLNHGGTRREEEYELHGGIFAVEFNTDEAAAEAARERAYTMLAELDAQLREKPRIVQGVYSLELARADLDQFIHDEACAAAVEFAVAVKART